jgi:hypothetical protein
MLPGMRFTASLWEHSPGGWCFVSVPQELSEVLRDQGGPRRGFGSLRVEVTVGESTWRTSVFPARGGHYDLPVKKTVRRSEDLEPGDRVEVRLELLD